MVMKKEITLGSLLSILVPLSVLLLTWGMSISTRIGVQDVEISTNRDGIEKNSNKIEKVDDKIGENFKIMIDKLDRILYQKLNDK